MKACIILGILTLVVVTSVHGQEYKKFRVGLGLGYAKAPGSGMSGGSLWALEPGYRLSDRMLMNFRFELAAIIRSSIDEPTKSAVISYGPNCQYYLNTNAFRPFAGIGVGHYQVFSAPEPMLGSPTQGMIRESKIGFYPRLGFDLKRNFTFNIDYNFIPQSSVRLGNKMITFKNNYFGFRVGGYFGGGRKKTAH